ncbi:MAG: AraC family transcriptional regulator [Tissierellia bacterium]|nr:AraC family transcriptional regulator [Tissierellia bacterium]
MGSKDGNNYWTDLYNKNNYYRHFILDAQNGDVFSLKGNGYSVIGNSLVYKIADGIHMFKTEAIYQDVDLKGLDSYADDALVIYKVKKGKILMEMLDGRERRLKGEDILNAASNFKMSKFHSFQQEVEFVGVTFYYKYMLEAIENQSLNQSFLEDFYKNELLQDVFVHRGNYRINRLFEEIENAIHKDHKMLMKAKSLELLSESSLYYKNFMSLDYETLSEEKKKLFQEIKGFLDTNLDQYYSMAFIAKKFSISLTGLKNLFHEVYGISPYRYHLDKRLEKAAILLEETDYKINDIYNRVGFHYHSNFSNAFQNKYHCTPSQYRKSKK